MIILHVLFAARLGRRTVTVWRRGSRPYGTRRRWHRSTRRPTTRPHPRGCTLTRPRRHTINPSRHTVCLRRPSLRRIRLIRRPHPLSPSRVCQPRSQPRRRIRTPQVSHAHVSSILQARFVCLFGFNVAFKHLRWYITTVLASSSGTLTTQKCLLG